MIPLRSAAEIVGRLEWPAAAEPLLVDVPPELEKILTESAAAGATVSSAAAAKIRSVKGSFDFILLWQEDRVGSRAVLAAAQKRLQPDGRLWVATAMRKIQGPRTPAVHRLGLEDLKKAFAKEKLVCDREVRLSAWHTAYRFVRPDSSGPRSKID
ncbi:MAG: hypothetical protein ABI968_08410 [Acidobacteriota bacterium]